MLILAPLVLTTLLGQEQGRAQAQVKPLPLTPAEAAAILLPNQYRYIPPSTGPRFIIAYLTDRTLPPIQLSDRRLDGTPLSQPPTVYGLPMYGHGFGHGYGRGSGGSGKIVYQ